MTGKHAAHIEIPKHACAYAGLSRDELRNHRTQMTSAGRWNKGMLRRLMILVLSNRKAASDRRSSVTSHRPSQLTSSRASSEPLAALPLNVTPTKPVNAKSGTRKGAKATENIAQLLSKDHIHEPERSTESKKKRRRRWPHTSTSTLEMVLQIQTFTIQVIK